MLTLDELDVVSGGLCPGGYSPGGPYYFKGAPEPFTLTIKTCVDHPDPVNGVDYWVTDGYC
jgi:hypothetical protein